MGAGGLGGFGSARVHHDQVRPIADTVAQAPPAIGHLAQPAQLADCRIAAQHQHTVGSIDVGDQGQPFQPEHAPGGGVMGIGVDGEHAEGLMRADRVQQPVVKRPRAKVEAAGVAKIAADRIGAMAGDDGGKALGNVGDGLIIGCGDKAASFAPHGRAQPPWAVHDLARALRLHAEVAPAIGVLLVRPDGDDLTILRGDGKAAQLFADVAVCVGHTLRQLADPLRGRFCSWGEVTAESPC